ncbi:hypothetical protein CVT24_005334 [Panaeolus cyanescens]|uniref:Nop52-domain-containing protein n=1 Tax=Panaeolus cyanescens TaxID=181874 RepID=A0A409Y8Y9_9AGAR|nr:hypothetical protein CVT24_005334 [Panaeolus cyanescens]
MDSTLPLGKYLASTEKKTRDKAIKSLAGFFSEGQDVLSKSDMDKLWKGIFYCFWMSDKPLVQQALATELAELVLTISSTPSSLAFLRGFWETIVREWNGIDRLRIDKYYMLIRRFVNATFRLLMRTGWNKHDCETSNNILMEGPLNADDIRVPTSLAYHISDVFVEELDKALSTDASCSPAPLAVLLHPFLNYMARAPTSVAYKRVLGSVLEPLFSALDPNVESDGETRKSKRHKLDDGASYSQLVANSTLDSTTSSKMAGPALKRLLLKRVFDIAGQPETRDSSRRKMYALWKENYDEDVDSS